MAVKCLGERPGTLLPPGPRIRNSRGETATDTSQFP